MTMTSLIDDLQSYHDSYIKWLKDKTCLKEVDKDIVEITTPHLDRHNDCIQFYVQKDANRIIFTDGGYILDDLEASGVIFNTPKRKRILHTILAGFGVIIDDDNCLKTYATADNFALRKNNFIQAMLAVNNMFTLASSNVANLFHEDVALWLDENDVRYMKNVKLSGMSGFDFMFDFAIPKHKNHPERMIQVINNPTSDSIKQVLFSWHDTKPVRDDNARLYVAINDDEHSVSKRITNSLMTYDVVPLLWKDRQDFIEQLVA